MFVISVTFLLSSDLVSLNLLFDYLGTNSGSFFLSLTLRIIWYRYWR